LPKDLVIVESPAKARTIAKLLSGRCVVEATMGHVRDLPRSRFGIDLEKGFTPTYVAVKGRGPIIAKLRKAVAKAGTVFLAVDPDREGEAIAWHVRELLKLPEDRVRRVELHEITSAGVKEAFAHQAAIDMDKVNAQQARRILDRIVGYKVSPLLWRSVTKGLSAGRVQSVAVRLIVEREREILAFRPEEYWEIAAKLATEDGEGFEAKLQKVAGEKAAIGNEAEATAVVDRLAGQPFTVATVEEKEQKRRPRPPFNTSQLQQQASTALRFSAKKTMTIAQQLYEGVELPGEGAVGLITYMRTDSFRVADQAVGAARGHIEEAYGKDYLPAKPQTYKARRGAQEAHEAIRPTAVERTPESMTEHLSRDQARLYDLIWRRFVASQMMPAVVAVASAGIEAGDCLFAARGRRLRFDGHWRVVGVPGEDELLPKLTAGQTLTVADLEKSQHFTEPPPRFTEASLVKTLESLGIGRPSTYAPIISTIQDRGYVEQQKRAFHATELGMVVTDLLVEHFPKIMSVEFTSHMEDDLDKVESGEMPWMSALDEFYGPFAGNLERAQTGMKRVKDEMGETGKTCEKCGKPMVFRFSRRGKFLGCSGFPDCRNAVSLDGEGNAKPPPEKTDEVCEKCQSPMLVRTSRGVPFLGCSAYPKCRFTKSIPTGVKCPEEGCDGDLVPRRSRRGGRPFYGCSNFPKCKYITNKLPEEAADPAPPATPASAEEEPKETPQ
jgi:DNA topoisomerase-1